MKRATKKTEDRKIMSRGKNKNYRRGKSMLRGNKDADRRGEQGPNQKEGATKRKFRAREREQERSEAAGGG